MLTGTLTVMLAEADLVLSCTLVAVTTSLPLLAGAVYRPVLLMVPRCAVHANAEL